MSPDAELSQYMLYPLAKWAAELGYEDLPETVAHQARMSLLDTIGCIIAGFSHPASQSILAAEKELSAAAGKYAATVAVSGEPLSIPAAAKVNSCLGGVFELDDNTAGHGSLISVPVGLAVAEAHHLSGRELLTSMVATYEIAGRIYDSVFGNFKSFAVPTTAAHTAGAAAQTAKLLGADAKGIFDAINVALTFVPESPTINIMVGSQVKPLIFTGWPVYAGSFGALYAKAGLTAANNSYESEQGGYLAGATTSWNTDVLAEGLGQTWQLDVPNRKRHACCGYIHSSIDGSWDMLRENNIALDDIARIHVDLQRVAFTSVGIPKPGGLTPDAAKFYLPYILAVALIENRPIRPEDTSAETLVRNLADPNISKLMDRIDASPDDSIPGRFSSRLLLTTKDGREYTSFVEDALGRGKRQFTDQEIEDKFRTLASTELSKDAVDQIVETVCRIEQVQDVAALTKLLKK